MRARSKELKDTPATRKEQKSEHPILEIIRFSLIALVIVVPIRMFVAQPFIVSGNSMNDTFQNGQYLIVDQLTYHFRSPERGEVLIFRYPGDPSQFFIKRVIGVPGDVIMVRKNSVTIKNEELKEDLILEEPYVKTMTDSEQLSAYLDAGEYFVMGDNRDFSSDSRAWGVLSEEYVVGRAFVRLFPISEFDAFPGAYDGDILLGKLPNP